MTDVLRRAIHDLIYDPRQYWPEDTYFHRRNRQKLANAWAKVRQLRNLSPADVVDSYLAIIRARAERPITSLYLMSNGGSGCHYAGALLSEVAGLCLTDEVYFPPKLLTEIEGSRSPDAALAIDFLNFFHIGVADPEAQDLVAVNIGHLRPDAPPAKLRKYDRGGRLILLLRNPYDVAVSRAFRKPGYRAEVAPELSDDEYLQRQVNGSKAFLMRSRAVAWDRIIRYEQLTANPHATVGDLLREMGLSFDARLLGRSAAPVQSVNLNTDARAPLTAKQLDILASLGDLANEYGYPESEHMHRSRRLLRKQTTTTGAARPTPSGSRALWLPQHTYDHHYSEERCRRLQEGHLRVSRSLPEVPLVTDPSWEADPLSNKTWRLYYHSLSWLVALAWGVDHGVAEEAAQAHLVETITSYLDANVFAGAADTMAWDDHAAADRLAVLCYLWREYLSEPSPLIDERVFLEAMELHVDRLIEFYGSGRWLNSNHGLFHSLALLSFAVAFPASLLAHKAVEIGSDYLSRVVNNLVEPDEKVSTEQSLYYHQHNLMLLRYTKAFLDQSYPHLAIVLAGVTDGMVDFNLCVRTPGDIMPAIGDTVVAGRIPKDCLEPGPGEAHSNYLEFVRSRGLRGEPLPRFVLYPNTGYAVFRRGELGDGVVSRAVFLFQPERIAHGHFDALSITMHLAGSDILVDSGGPYVYGDPLRYAYFMASRAHNVVLVNGEDHQAAAYLLGHGDAFGCDWVLAGHNGYPGRATTRAVVSVGGAGFVIFDAVTGGESEATFETLWHHPPGTQVEVAAMANAVNCCLRIGGRRYSVHALASSELEVNVVEGQVSPSPQGWVTEAAGAKRPAPVQVVTARGMEHRAVTVLAQEGVEFRTSASGGDFAVTIDGYRVYSNFGEAPEIHRLG